MISKRYLLFYTGGFALFKLFIPLPRLFDTVKRS